MLVLLPCLLVSSQLILQAESGWSRGGGTVWASAAEEAKDEVNDPILYRAVLDSVLNWERHHKNTTRRRKREESEAISSICYPEVGCFSDSGYLDMLPSPPEAVSTRFLLYSARSGRRSDTPLLDVAFSNMSAIDDWAAKALNMSVPTKVIVHGFGSSCSNIWVYEMRSALMSVESCNVLCVDWEPGAAFPNYVRAAANTRLVGRQLSMLLVSLRDKHGLDLASVHIIGFSLGAHAAAFAGSHLGNVKRITGLDPAGPLFESQDPALRLDSSDAKFVDVIHSNGEALILGGLGSWQPMGHVDFYPNGGRMQKGCSNLFVGAFTDILWSGAAIEGRSLCNHRRAYKFFTDSVSPRCLFPAVHCSSYEAYLAGECFPCPEGQKCPSMGYYADTTGAKGTLYLVTRDEEPFCAHQYLVQVQSSPSALPVVSYGKIQLTLVTDAQINETFTLTQKDDEELVVGGVLSKIIVPHPALEAFNSLALLYTAYTGWISSGLAKWSIDKLTLTDALGRKMSVCEKEVILESGVPVELPLYKGDCSENKEPVNTTGPSFNASEIELVEPTASSVPSLPPFNHTQVVLSTEEETNSTLYRRSGLEWEPVLEVPERSGHTGNGLEATEEIGRGFKDSRVKLNKTTFKAPREVTLGVIKEPLLGATSPRPRPIEERWFPNPDLTPPAMGATESWKHWDLPYTPSSSPATSAKKSKQLDLSEGVRSFTVQLFPQRLAAILEQAERYARMALAPFRFSDEGRSRRFSFLNLPSLLSWASLRSEDSTPKHSLTELSDNSTVAESTTDNPPAKESNQTEIFSSVPSHPINSSSEVPPVAESSSIANSTIDS